MPGYDADYHDVHGEVDDPYPNDGKNDGERDNPAGVRHLIAQIGCGEIPQVIVDRDHQPGTESDKEVWSQTKGTWRKGESQIRVEMGSPRHNHHQDGNDHDKP